MTRSKTFTGFTLIEVLISMLLLSFGIIGAIKMQLVAMQTSQQSHFYSIAVASSADIAGKIRSYHEQIRLANLHRGLDPDWSDSSDSSDSPDLNPSLAIDFQSGSEKSSIINCISARCGQLEADISEWWLQHLHTALPNARAVICRDSSPWNNDTQSLVWDCASGDDASVVIKIGWADPGDDDDIPPPRLAVALHP